MSIPAPERIRGGSVYGLFATGDPEKKIRYVGKTVQNPKRRMSAHMFNARNGSQTPVAKWMRKHENAVEMLVLSEHADYASLCEAERKTIASLDTLTTNGGLNCTEGGDGSLGWVNGPEAIAKIVAKNSGRKQSAESIEKWKKSRAGWKHSAETRALMSERRKGRKPSPEHLAAVREARRKNRGEANPLSVLTAQQVAEIKSSIWDASMLQKTLAGLYGVDQAAISAIARERTWAHIPWPTDRPRTVLSRSQIRSTLSDETVREVRTLGASGVSLAGISERLDVSRSQAQRILSGKRYAHVK